MFQGGLFGTPQPLNNTGLTQQQPSMFGSQPTGLFAQPQQQQSAFFGQAQQPQQQNNPIGGGLFQQPQTQNQFGGGLQQQQQPQSLLNPQQLNNQQNQAIQFQQYLPQTNIKTNINNVQQMIDDLKKKRQTTGKLFDDINQAQQKQYLGPNFAQELQIKLKMLSNDLLESTKALAIQQRDLISRLDEYISSIGLLDKIAKDGLDALRVENQLYKEYQAAEQVITQSFQRQELTNQDNRFMSYYSQNDQSGFNVPQNYEYQLVYKLNQDIEKMGEAIIKLQQFQENNNFMIEDQENYDFDDIIDQHLQRKLQSMAHLSNLLFLLQQKIRDIQSRADNFRSKSFAILYPEKNKLLNDFHSIDIAKDFLQNIASKELNIN